MKIDARRDAAILGRAYSDMGRESSISDAGLYPAFCLLASSNDKVFRRFRRSRIYTEVLEHVTHEQGWQYLHEIQAGGRLLESMKAVLENDGIGGPRRWRYGSYGMVSPTTLRYVKVATDLHNLFGSLNDLRVAEIGIGYGGQCRVLSTAWSPQSYYLFDLPEVLALSRRFLEAANADRVPVVEVDGREPSPVKVDLVISNYAFSELNRDMQELYLDRLVQKAPRGYITYNHISAPEVRSLTAHEMAERVPGARVLPERPETFPGNALVVWGGSWTN